MHQSKGSRKSFALALLAAAMSLVLLLAGCGGGSSSGSSSDSSSPASGESSEGGGEITLGFTATLTGESASYGLMMRKAIELHLEEINAAGGIDGKQVKIISEDDQGEPSNGPVVAQKFCDDESVDAILGYSYSSVALAAIPVFNQCKIPVVASAVTSPELSGASPYFFRNIPTDAAQGIEMGRYSVEQLGLKKIGVLYQQDDYGLGTSDSFIEGVEEAGGTITYHDAYQLGTTDFNAQVSKMISSGAEAIYIGGFYTEAAKISQQARAAGFEGQILATDGSLAPDLIELGGDAVEGVILYGAFVPTIKKPEVQKFVKAFNAKYGEDPTSAAALAYDAVAIVQQAIEVGGDSREGIVGELPEADIEGVTGQNTFNSEHDRVAEVIFLEVKNGEFEVAEKQGK